MKPKPGYTIIAPASGKEAKAARLISQSVGDRRRWAELGRVTAMPKATAGAGPSRLMASTSTTSVAGYVRSGGSYLVYANASDAGSGISTVKADVSGLTSGQTALALSACTTSSSTSDLRLDSCVAFSWSWRGPVWP